jgi:hypothetical protein
MSGDSLWKISAIRYCRRDCGATFGTIIELISISHWGAMARNDSRNWRGFVGFRYIKKYRRIIRSGWRLFYDTLVSLNAFQICTFFKRFVLPMKYDTGDYVFAKLDL